MNNVYDDPDYENVVKKLKKELKRLQSELRDAPRDIGDNPRLGVFGSEAVVHIEGSECRLG